MSASTAAAAEEKKRRRAIEMYQAHVKTADIQAETGISRPRLYALLEAEGITPSRIRRPRPVGGDGVSPVALLDKIDAQGREIGRLETELREARTFIGLLMSKVPEAMVEGQKAGTNGGGGHAAARKRPARARS